MNAGCNRRELANAKIGDEVLHFIAKPTESKPVHAKVTATNDEFVTLMVLGGPITGPQLGTDIRLDVDSLVFAIRSNAEGGSCIHDISENPENLKS